MPYDSGYIFQSVGAFFFNFEITKVRKITASLFRKICGTSSYGQLEVKVDGNCDLTLLLRKQDGYVWEGEDYFYPHKFPVVFQETLNPEELSVILKNPKVHRFGMFYQPFVSLLLSLEDLLKDVIEGKNMGYSFIIRFKSGNPDRIYFFVDGLYWSDKYSRSTLNTVEDLKKRYLLSVIPIGTKLPSKRELQKKADTIVKGRLNDISVLSLSTISRPRDWETYFMGITKERSGTVIITQSYYCTEKVGGMEEVVEKNTKVETFQKEELRSVLGGRHPRVYQILNDLDKLFRELPPQFIPDIRLDLAYLNHMEEIHANDFEVVLIFQKGV